MVRTLTLVLLGIVAYTLAAMVLRMRGLLPDSVKVSGPIITLHTRRGKVLLDRLARPRRFWRAWGNLGVGIALVVMAGSFLLVVFAGLQAVNNPQPTPLNQPRNVLAIPGVNQFLPLSAAVEIVAGLVVGLVVHEGGHGLMCRVEDIDIESMGLAFLAFVPIGAFVEPDEASRNRTDRGGQTRMFAGGVTNNFAVAIAALFVLFGPVIGSISVAAGVPVGGSLPGSPADRAGIDRGDVITAVNGQPVQNESDLERTLAGIDERTVAVSLRNRDEPVPVEREVVVTGAARDAPVAVNTTIESVNGTAVHTRQGLRDAVADRPVARLETSAGPVTAPMGAFTIPIEDGAFAAAGAPAGEPVVVTAIDGQRILDHRDLAAALDDTAPGQEITVVGYTLPDRVGANGDSVGDREEWTATLREDPGGSGGFLGVGLQRGVSGFTVDDFGTDAYPAAAFLSVLGGGDTDAISGGSFVQRTFAALTLPFAAATIPGLDYGFAGFVGGVENFYTVSGPLSILGAGVAFFVANLLFWTAWINLVIGQFNCIPAYPLDGGHILRTSTEAVVARLPVEDRRSVTRVVTTSVSLVMLAGVFLMVFGPRLLT